MHYKSASILVSMKRREIGIESILTLFEEAKKNYITHPLRSHEYVSVALKIARKSRLRLPSSVKYSYCKNCRHYLFPGKNMTQRIRQKTILLTCHDCKSIRKLVVQPS